MIGRVRAFAVTSKKPGGPVETTRYWPRRIERPEDVPPAFEEQFADSADESAEVVYVPAPGSLSSAQKEHLVVWSDESLAIHTAQGDRRSVLGSALGEIEQLEWGSVLLHSWMTIWAGGGSVTIHFNSVREDLFRPLVTTIRRASWTGEDERALQDDHAAPGLSAGSEAEKLRHLRPRTIKFVNYGSRCLLPGERIVSTLFQELFSARARRGGRFVPLRWYVSPHLFVLTDRELVFLREEHELALLKRYAYQYGCVREFVARSRVADVHVDERDGFRELVVRTTSDRTIRSKFALDNAELPIFLRAAREIAGKPGVLGASRG
jgi:hypothetical protein